MRIPLALVATLLLAGCAGAATATPIVIADPVNLSATATAAARTPTAATTTTAGYRQMLKVRGDEINAAIEALHDGCDSSAVADCTTALATFDAATVEPERLIRTTKTAEGCGGLFSVYAGLMEHLPLYRSQLRDALATNDTAKVVAVNEERYRAWSEQWGKDPQNVQRDTCP